LFSQTVKEAGVRVKQPKLRQLIHRAQNGDQDAIVQIIQRLMPLIKKYSHHNEDDEVELMLWVTQAVRRYKPNTTWGRDELRRWQERSR
jgi:DNA-directed RNA polymerase specialized sigma subunit